MLLLEIGQHLGKSVIFPLLYIFSGHKGVKIRIAHDYRS